MKKKKKLMLQMRMKIIAITKVQHKPKRTLKTATLAKIKEDARGTIADKI